MSQPPVYKFDVQVLNSEAISPDSIVRSPRTFKPQDLLAARQNMDIICSSPDPAPAVAELVEFILGDFFIQAHRTGLYNRQKNLWESLSKVTSVSVFQLRSGIFKRVPVPLFDLHLQDFRGRPFILGHLVDPTFEAGKTSSETLLKRFLRRAEKLPGLTGLFFCCPAQEAQSLRTAVSKLTGGDDPVGRYEARLPEPLSVPLNLVGLGPPEPDRKPGLRSAVHLVHPDLSAIKRIRAAAVREE